MLPNPGSHRAAVTMNDMAAESLYKFMPLENNIDSLGWLQFWFVLFLLLLHFYEPVAQTNKKNQIIMGI